MRLTIRFSTGDIAMKGAARRNNPWELLVIALLYLLPSVGLLTQKKPTLLLQARRSMSDATILTPPMAHVFGGFAILVSLTFVILYFYVRYSAGREEKSQPPRFLETDK